MSIRNTLIKKRRALSEMAQIEGSRRVFEKIVTLPLFKNAQKIAFYQAHCGEIRCNDLIQHAFDQNKQVFLPVLDPTRPNHLLFVAYQENDRLIKNSFGIEEPVLLDENNISAETLDLVFAPLVAFDNQHHRIGMGKGYYDRSFAFKKETPQSKPLLVGLGYAFQRVPDFVPKPWDVLMDEIITP